jgi:hypothetical protein
MATPSTAAIAAGDLSAPFETSPTTRVTNTLERMLAPAFNNSRRLLSATVAAFAADAPPCGRARTCEPDADVLGQPQRPDSDTWPHRRLVSRVNTADRREPDSAPLPGRAHSRDLDIDVMQTTSMRAAARCDLFFVRVDPCSWFCPSVQRLGLTCGVARPLRPRRIARRRRCPRFEPTAK